MNKSAIHIFFLVLFSIVNSYAKDSAVTDSLWNELARLDQPKEKIIVLNSLIDHYFDDPKETQISRQIFTLARQINDKFFIAKAAGTLSRHYYNHLELDSLKHWCQVFDTITFSEDISPYYFNSRSYRCLLEVENKKLEEGYQHAVELTQKATELNSPRGMATSYELLGLIYNTYDQHQESLKYFLLSLESIKKEKTQRPGDLAYIYSLIIDEYMALNNIGKARDYMHFYGEVINNERRKSSSPLPIDRCHWQYLSYQLLACCKNGETAQAREYMRLLTSCRKTDDWYVNMQYRTALINYFNLKGDFLSATAQLEELEKIPYANYTDLMLLKADTYRKNGKFSQANGFLSEALKNMERLKSDNLKSEIGQLRAYTEKHSLENRLLADEIRAGRKKSLLGLIFILLFVVGLSFIINRYLRTRRTRQQLSASEEEQRKDRNQLLSISQHLEVAKEKAEESDRLKSAFLANMSHEIRTPLNSIVGFSQLIAQSARDNSEQKAFSNIILENSALLLNLVNNILDLSRLDSDMMKFDVRSYQLQPLIDECITHTDQNLRQFINIEMPHIPCTVSTDKTRLMQIISNLLDNAFKFAPQKPVSICCTKMQHSALIEISDCGPGIPENKKEMIFERFEKLDMFTPGPGLGLSLCRSLAEKLSMSITLDSTYKKGARFLIELPCD